MEPPASADRSEGIYIYIYIGEYIKIDVFNGICVHIGIIYINRLKSAHIYA